MPGPNRQSGSIGAPDVRSTPKTTAIPLSEFQSLLILLTNLIKNNKKTNRMRVPHSVPKLTLISRLIPHDLT